MLELLTSIVFVAFTIAFLLLLWFNTDFVAEWADFFFMKKLFKVEEFRLAKLSSETPLSYAQFLRISNSGFFTKLITCRICLCVWFGLVFFVPLGMIGAIPMTCILALILYGIVTNLLHL